LDHRLRSAECVAVNGLGAEVNFATDQAVPPERIDLDAVGEESGDALVVGTADEDDLGVSVDGETVGRPLLARRCGFLAFLGLDVMGGDEAIRPVAQLGGAGVMEAFPDFSLPEVVVGLDLVLDSVFARRSEDGDDAQGQAEERDGAKTVGMMMRTVKAEVVVELSVGA